MISVDSFLLNLCKKSCAKKTKKLSVLFKINILLDFSFQKCNRSSELTFLLVLSKFILEDKTDLFQAVSSRAGHVPPTFLKLFCSVLEQVPSVRLFRSCSFFSIVPFSFRSVEPVSTTVRLTLNPFL